jgi:predicted O-methyltransferase YrrM
MSRLLPMRPMIEWWGVDRWTVPRNGDSYKTSGATIADCSQEDFDTAYHQVVALARAIGPRAHILVSDSVDAASQFLDGILDLVFIDADHSYEGCLRDIHAWLPKVKRGGWICGHDYANKSGEVKKAVDEVFNNVEFGRDHTWFKKVL